MARQLETLAGIGDLRAVNLEDGNILVEIIADQQILSVWREHRPFRQSADLEVANPADLLAVDAQYRDATIAFVKIGILVVGTCQDNGDGNIALGRDGKPLRSITYDHTVGDARRIYFEIDYTHGIDTAVGGPSRHTRLQYLCDHQEQQGGLRG
jgi:hypothetical protein